MNYKTIIIVVILVFVALFGGWYKGYHDGWDAGRSFNFKKMFTETIQEQQEVEEKKKQRLKPKVFREDLLTHNFQVNSFLV